MKIISGNSNIELSKEISEYLKIQLSEVNMTRFSDKAVSYTHLTLPTNHPV